MSGPRVQGLKKRKARSRLTNGRFLFPPGEVDGRSKWVRRFSDVIAKHIADLGFTKIEDVQPASLWDLVRRAATLTVELEKMELRFAQAADNGEDATAADLDLYQRMSKSLRLVLKELAPHRKDKDSTLTPLDYVKGRHRFEDDDDE